MDLECGLSPFEWVHVFAYKSENTWEFIPIFGTIYNLFEVI